MTALKDILLETNITFTTGIKIINMDKSHTILAHLQLHHDRFEQYECKLDKIIGVNMLHLFKLINTINDDTLTIYIEDRDYKDGVVQYLGLKFENGDIRQQKFQKLRLIEPEHEELEVPDVTFSSVLNLPHLTSKRSFVTYLASQTRLRFVLFLVWVLITVLSLSSNAVADSPRQR